MRGSLFERLESGAELVAQHEAPLMDISIVGDLEATLIEERLGIEPGEAVFHLAEPVPAQMRLKATAYGKARVGLIADERVRRGNGEVRLRVCTQHIGEGARIHEVTQTGACGPEAIKIVARAEAANLCAGLYAGEIVIEEDTSDKMSVLPVIANLNRAKGAIGTKAIQLEGWVSRFNIFEAALMS